MKNVIRIHESDNVAVAIEAVPAGAALEVGGATVVAAGADDCVDSPEQAEARGSRSSNESTNIPMRFIGVLLSD